MAANCQSRIGTSCSVHLYEYIILRPASSYERCHQVLYGSSYFDAVFLQGRAAVYGGHQVGNVRV